MDQLDETVFGFTVKTWSERQESGWFLVVGFWWQDSPAPDSSEDDRVQVGPFDTQELANAELTGAFRKLIHTTLKNYAKKRGGFILDGRALDRGGWPRAS